MADPRLSALARSGLRDKETKKEVRFRLLGSEGEERIVYPGGKKSISTEDKTTGLSSTPPFQSESAPNTIDNNPLDLTANDSPTKKPVAHIVEDLSVGRQRGPFPPVLNLDTSVGPGTPVFLQFDKRTPKGEHIESISRIATNLRPGVGLSFTLPGGAGAAITVTAQKIPEHTYTGAGPGPDTSNRKRLPLKQPTLERVAEEESTKTVTKTRRRSASQFSNQSPQQQPTEKTHLLAATPNQSYLNSDDIVFESKYLVQADNSINITPISPYVINFRKDQALMIQLKAQNATDPLNLTEMAVVGTFAMYCGFSASGLVHNFSETFGKILGIKDLDNLKAFTWAGVFIAGPTQMALSSRTAIYNFSEFFRNLSVCPYEDFKRIFLPGALVTASAIPTTYMPFTNPDTKDLDGVKYAVSIGRFFSAHGFNGPFFLKHIFEYFVKQSEPSSPVLQVLSFSSKQINKLSDESLITLLHNQQQGNLLKFFNDRHVDTAHENLFAILRVYFEIARIGNRNLPGADFSLVQLLSYVLAAPASLMNLKAALKVPGAIGLPVPKDLLDIFIKIFYAKPLDKLANFCSFLLGGVILGGPSFLLNYFANKAACENFFNRFKKIYDEGFLNHFSKYKTPDYLIGLLTVIGSTFLGAANGGMAATYPFLEYELVRIINAFTTGAVFTFLGFMSIDGFISKLADKRDQHLLRDALQADNLSDYYNNLDDFQKKRFITLLKDYLTIYCNEIRYGLSKLDRSQERDFFPEDLRELADAIMATIRTEIDKDWAWVGDDCPPEMDLNAWEKRLEERQKAESGNIPPETKQSGRTRDLPKPPEEIGLSVKIPTQEELDFAEWLGLSSEALQEKINLLSRERRNLMAILNSDNEPNKVMDLNIAKQITEQKLNKMKKALNVIKANEQRNEDEYLIVDTVLTTSRDTLFASSHNRQSVHPASAAAKENDSQPKVHPASAAACEDDDWEQLDSPADLNANHSNATANESQQRNESLRGSQPQDESQPKPRSWFSWR